MKISRRSFMKAASLMPLLAVPAGIRAGVQSPESIDRPKLKLSLNAYSFNRLLQDGEMDLFQLLDFCAENNLDAIDPTGYYFPGYPEVPGDEYINRFKKQAFLQGLDISGTGVRNDFSNPDASEREKDLEHIKEWIVVASKMGAPCIRLFAGRNMPEGYSQADVNEWVVEGLTQAADYGKYYGVMIAMQNHNDFIKTSDHLIEIMETANHDWLGLHLDIGSLRQGNPYEEIKKVVPYAITWQIKELVYFDGKPRETDLKKVFQIAADAGYRGYLPLETLGEGDPYKKVEKLIAGARKALATVETPMQ
ncbi:MAG: sugar phosphate isomerase/epimerase family protein [Bacteroidales bacterium]|nr:sugar phosphate isomerase/epimerase [Bacteroidales bacterium]MBS3775275.1 sugar phosphate isomerase/epimerase [Bacteroidales bacterium]